MSELVLHNKVGGYFKLEATKPDGSQRVVADWFPNLITDYGLEAWASQSDMLSYCRVGSGTATPTVTDTQLGAQVASVLKNGNTAGSQPTAPYYVWATYTYIFPIGTAAGNLSEIGVGHAATGATLWSRARIKDGSNNDTTITILADEQLTVNYQLRMYVPTTDVTGSLTIGGVSRDFVLRAANCTGSWTNTAGQSQWHNVRFGQPRSDSNLAFSGSLGAITAQPTGTSSASGTTPTTAAYSSGSKYVDITVTWGTGVGNVAGGVGAMLLRTMDGDYQASFSPVLEKDITKTMSITIRQSWGRY